MRIDNLGIEFRYHGDHIIWVWPWRRKGLPKYISILASGTGEFGDARFGSLAAIDRFWYEFNRCCSRLDETGAS